MQLPRTLIIGIDGATFTLIKPWAEAGLLPTFAHLLKHGGHATLDAYPFMNSAAAWTNLVTGYNPGKHGIFNFTVQAQGMDTSRPTSARDRHKPAFWHTLAASGQRVGVMNVPITFPAEQVNGFMVSGMDTPDTNSRGFTSPEGIFQELQRAGIEYVIDSPDLQKTALQGVDTVPSSVRDMTLARTRSFLYLLEKYPCDAAMLVYIGSDRMSHYFWRETPPAADSPEWKPLRDLFVLYDTQLQEILQHADSQTTVFLISDHGFGSMGPKYMDLDKLLQQLGYQVRNNRPSRKTLLGTLLQTGRRTVPQQWQSRLAARFPRAHVRAVRSNEHGSFDWAKTRAYAQKGGGLRINSERRSSHGIVPDAEYAALWQELAEMLTALTDPKTGQPIVAGIHHPDEFYSGPLAENAYDMYIRWNRKIVGTGFEYRQDGHNLVMLTEQAKNGWLGNHHPDGIFMAYGNGIRPGIVHPPVTHFDLAPTVLYLHDQPIADDMDGHVLADWFEPEMVSKHVINIQTASDYAPARTQLDPAENQMIENRLRALGYID